MISFDDVTKENMEEHNPYWPRIPDHPYSILIIGGSGSGKRKTLLSLVIMNQILIKFIYMLKSI